MPFEFIILDWIQLHIQCTLLDIVMPILTQLGNSGVIWILFTAIMLCIPKTRKYGVIMFLSLLLEFICCNLLLKPLVARIRPYEINTAISLLVPPPTDYSFPSGHSGAAFAIVSALYYAKHRFWIPSIFLAIALAFSRLYLYVHFPTDVLGGILLGWVSGWIVNKLFIRLNFWRCSHVSD